MSSNLLQRKENYMAELNWHLPAFLGSGAKFLAHAHIAEPACVHSFLHPSSSDLAGHALISKSLSCFKYQAWEYEMKVQDKCSAGSRWGRKGLTQPSLGRKGLALAWGHE